MLVLVALVMSRPMLQVSYMPMEYPINHRLDGSQIRQLYWEEEVIMYLDQYLGTQLDTSEAVRAKYRNMECHITVGY